MQKKPGALQAGPPDSLQVQEGLPSAPRLYPRSILSVLNICPQEPGFAANNAAGGGLGCAAGSGNRDMTRKVAQSPSQQPSNQARLYNMEPQEKHLSLLPTQRQSLMRGRVGSEKKTAGPSRAVGALQGMGS